MSFDGDAPGGSARPLTAEILATRDVVVLRSGFTAGDDYFLDAMRKRNIAADFSLRPLRWRPLRGLRRFHLRSRIPGKSVWFGRWLRKGLAKKLIIVHAADLTLPAAVHAARRFPEARVVFWFWNPAGKGTSPRLASRSEVELWSFDEGDCVAYDMHFNTQFSFVEIGEIGETVSPEIDLGFYGSDKGRASTLSTLADQADRLGLTCCFEVVPGPMSQLNLHPKLFLAKQLPYENILVREARARVVVDIVQEGQSGMTLRTLEALFLQRKLLTNLASVQDLELYDPSRIFILGQDDIEELPKFISAEPPEVDGALLRYYDFDAWLSRFVSHLSD